MSIEALPVESGLNYYEYEVELDGVRFLLEFRYVVRDDAWYLSILDTDGTPLRMSLKVVPQWPLLHLWVDENKPGGDIQGVSRGSSVKTPGIDDLGVEVILVYLDESEVLSLV